MNSGSCSQMTPSWKWPIRVPCHKQVFDDFVKEIIASFGPCWPILAKDTH